jgi:hypothetical protein
MYNVLVNDPPSIYKPGWFPRKYRYRRDAEKAAQAAVDAGASFARVEFPDGAELDFRPKIKKFKSLSEAFDRARAGEKEAQQCLISCLENFGCDHLAKPATPLDPKWKRCWHGIQEYLNALVGEYHLNEAKAEREVLAELNNTRDYCSKVSLV